MRYNQFVFERPCSNFLFYTGTIETAIQVTFDAVVHDYSLPSFHRPLMKFGSIDVAGIFYPINCWSVMPDLERLRHCNSRAFHGFPGG
jgi:hypothetical protein